MTDTPATTPAKPESPQPVKAPAKPAKPAASKATVNAPTIKTSPLNPAWAAEVVKAHGFGPPLAEPIAAYLTEAISKQLEKATGPDKLTKLIKEAAVASIGKYA